METTDRPVRDETRRPMVERAGNSTASQLNKVPEAPLIAQLTQRINECRQRVLDAAARVRMHSDAVLGSVETMGEDANFRGVPVHNGALGIAFSELASLEAAILVLEGEVPRLDNLA